MSYIKNSANADKKQFNVRLPTSVVDALDKLKADVEALGQELDVAALVADGIMAGIKKANKELASVKGAK